MKRSVSDEAGGRRPQGRLCPRRGAQRSGEKSGVSRLTGEDDLKQIEKKVRDVVTEAAEFATNSPEPDPAELWTDIYR